jgi:hypothetical protein
VDHLDPACIGAFVLQVRIAHESGGCPSQRHRSEGIAPRLARLRDKRLLHAFLVIEYRLKHRTSPVSAIACQRIGFAAFN